MSRYSNDGTFSKISRKCVVLCSGYEAFSLSAVDLSLCLTCVVLQVQDNRNVAGDVMYHGSKQRLVRTFGAHRQQAALRPYDIPATAIDVTVVQ